MKPIAEQLANYKSVHLDSRNMISHFIGIPLIVWAITVLLSLTSFQAELGSSQISYTPAMVLFAVSLLYYAKLHLKLAAGMLVYILLNLYLASFAASAENAFSLAIAVFVLGWILQFIGHIYEKAKPAFFDDIMGLIIGPIFLMAELYFALGFEQKLEQQVSAMAKEKRQLINNKR
ncbi:Uncharacterized membrane protein YGL010W [Colwellia chukchiensis]|uniref:Uncharacterized membrane protein YGL010W n=1 Tax=Colwellia chukchiensis TaxID=641665 RepID=A0A1H7R454_9GAMM|nr:Mpo1-like protein [Colwellia chukchiensis]SEL55030.1 Uncharacterized membrane protein YGL010W [Colwellia chukchiensis]